MITQTLIQIFERDLNRLKTEVSSYKNEADMWKVDKDISNSAGNLCLHLIGNLKFFIGATLGESGFKRDREAEFKTKNIPASVLCEDIDETMRVIRYTLDQLTDKDYQKPFPVDVTGTNPTTEGFLIHLTTHLNYHLGQINYHRRLLG